MTSLNLGSGHSFKGVSAPFLACLSASFLHSYRLCSDTAFNNALSAPPIVRPSASMSLVSVQYKLRRIACANLPPTEMRCNFSDDSARSQQSLDSIASCTALASAQISIGNCNLPVSNKCIIFSADWPVPQYTCCNVTCRANHASTRSTGPFNSAKTMLRMNSRVLRTMKSRRLALPNFD